MVEPGEKEWPVGEVDQGRTRAPATWLSAVCASTRWFPAASALSLVSP